jgi:hypothetical protein
MSKDQEQPYIPRTDRLKKALSTDNPSIHGDPEVANKLTPEQRNDLRDQMFTSLFKQLGLDTPEGEAELNSIRQSLEKGDSVPPVGRVRPPRARQRKKRNGE